VTVRLFGSDAALVDERLHEGVVLGDLGELAVAEHIAPRVADVNEPKFVASEQDCGERSAHALELGIALDVGSDRRIALPHRIVELGEQIAPGLVVVEMREGGDHQLGCHLAGGVAAHPIGQRQQSCARVDGVFVVGADKPTVAARGVTEDERHGRSSITVLPIRTGVPIGTRTAVVTLSLSRYVPLVDPRSSTYHSAPCWDNLAWRVEA